MKGSCLCGKVKYEIEKFEADIANCYCTMCRKNSGSAFATYGSVRSINLNWTAGKEHIKVYKSSAQAERGFCENCGSSLFFRMLGQPADYEIALGTLDDEPDHLPNANIFYDSRAKWSDQNETLPKYSKGRSNP